MRSERDKTAVRWKEGNNCYLTLPAQGRLHVRDTWDDSMREVEVSCCPPADARVRHQLLLPGPDDQRSQPAQPGLDPWRCRLVHLRLAFVLAAPGSPPTQMHSVFTRTFAAG